MTSLSATESPRDQRPGLDVLRSWFVAALALSAGCDFASSGAHSETGATSQVGSIAMTGPGVDFRTGDPSIVYGWMELSGHKTYSYVIVAPPLRTRPGRFKTGGSGNSTISSKSYSAEHMVELNGSSMSIRHVASLNATQDGITDEKLFLDGKEVDLSKGRLLLIDDWTIQGGWRQLAQPLPSVDGAADKQPALTRAMVEALAEVTPELATYLDD
jgi:hypothetical protein